MKKKIVWFVIGVTGTILFLSGQGLVRDWNTFNRRLNNAEYSLKKIEDSKYSRTFWECGDLTKDTITRSEFESGSCREIKMKQVY